MQFCEDSQRQGLKPDSVTYSALISACEKGQNLPKALQIWKDLQRQGVKPTIFTYSALFPLPPRQRGQASGGAEAAVAHRGFGHHFAATGRDHFTPRHVVSSYTMS